ncbi:GGDEF domain-containing protein [Novosphingobium marinum]|nr:GGDEF domain-containing protein [Novosphingobium marinum]
MYVLFTLALAIVAVVDRRLVSARWAALGFAIAGASIIVDGYREPGGDRWVSWFTVATHFLPLLIMLQAFLSRHRRNAPAFAAILTMMAAVFVMPDMPWAPPHWLRGVAVQATCTTIIAAGLPALWALRREAPVDWIAFGVVAGAALSYAGRTVVIFLNPIGDSQADVVAFYEGLNIAFHSMSALMGMSVGIVLLMTIGYDMLRGRIEESEIDPLTQLGNRRRFEKRIAEDGAGRRRVGAVLVIDLDHFKRVNDQFGHDAGDEILRAVGAKLNALFEGLGTVCRTGGEEFVVLLDDRHAEAVSALALSARAGIAALSFDGQLAGTGVTASVGFHYRAGDEDVPTSIRYADQAVYCAKADGRDRVVSAAKVRGLQTLRAVA